MSAESFNREAWQRTRLRELEAENAALRKTRGELEELASALCRVGARTIGGDPRDVLAAALEFVQAERESQAETLEALRRELALAVAA